MFNEYEMPRIPSRNGKLLPNYNEANMDYDLSEPEEGYVPPSADKGEQALYPGFHLTYR